MNGKRIRAFYVNATAWNFGDDVQPHIEVGREKFATEFDDWLAYELAEARREGQAEGMRSAASWLEGGTPRAWGFQHPCDPPGTRWEPDADERRLLYAVDAIREAANRIESEASDE